MTYDIVYDIVYKNGKKPYQNTYDIVIFADIVYDIVRHTYDIVCLAYDIVYDIYNIACDIVYAISYAI